MNKNDQTTTTRTDTDWQTQLNEKNSAIQRLERELKIEAALERVRARAMAMQNSNELSALVDTVFKELTKLDFALNWCMINIIDESSLSNMVWAANPDTEKVPESYHMKFEDYPFHHAMMKTYKERKSKYVYVIEGLEKKEYDEYLFNDTAFRKVPPQAQAASRAMEKYVVSFTFSNFGGLQTVGNQPLSEVNLDILERFGKVFDLTYTRFNDLLKAEAQSRESQIQLALERVRARTMAMQKSEELKDVIQVVYDQFVYLHINIEHTGFIIDYKERDDMNIWLADRHEVPTRLVIPYFDSPHWNSFIEAKEKGTIFFSNHLDFEEKNKFYKDLFELIPGLPEETKEYYFSCAALAISTVLLENVGLYIENFSGTPYTDEENNTLMRFGRVFQQTYTRFNDLKIAEALSIQAKEDLIKLQVTQKQLIQSEKMASLGELTAGIAHEIQNPLNFVNNFSEVNQELISEIKEELGKGNLEDVLEIATQIGENEEKITHHGKRADAIVKSMLLHSQSATGKMDPADMNALADEYLRLSYHGLRAKDTSFNATMQTDYDASVGSISMVPQDIGRVLLNLFNNAFYAVSEKKKQRPEGYEPTVSVSTKKVNDKVEIRVRDNGNGIPQKVKDKIFQPFFTTKPTGQGTGLGLSLSYDIIKAHGGEIKVETKEGEFTEFLVQIPAV
jgi:signal transduction histidine kinase